jgi:hypothetical protein
MNTLTTNYWAIITSLIGAIVYLQQSGVLPGDTQIKIRLLFILLCMLVIVSSFIFMIIDLIHWAQSF